ncbi:hypothetical protein AB0J38_36475 [Streptomyces sp. NPDC050095]|uniref:hypothetical protein n=1 Tax=unclassified Streptomyces TaxID=2593676 RepID=UPI00342F6AAC
MPGTAYWAITVAYDSGEYHFFEVLQRFRAPGETARQRLYEVACAHRHKAGLRERSRRVYRQGADAYYVRIEGRMSAHDLRFHLAELVWDSEKSPHPPAYSALPSPTGSEPRDAGPDGPGAPPPQ